MRLILVAYLVGLAAASTLANRVPKEAVAQYLRGTPVRALATPAPTTVPNCQQPKTACSAEDVDYVCGGSACWCNLTTEGEGVCFNSEGSCNTYKTCTASSDCPSSQKCFNVSSCACPQLKYVCSDIKPAVNGSCAF